MSNYAVRWTSAARADLEGIIGFIAEDRLDAALHILEKLRKKALDLSNMPERGRLVPELKAQGIIIYREIIHAPWRIIYKITGKTVYVLAVLDSRRNLEDILLDRFVD